MKKNNLNDHIEKILNDGKAENIVSIPLKGKSSLADYMIIASGTSSRHLQSLSENLVIELKRFGLNDCRIEGYESNDWKLVDGKLACEYVFGKPLEMQSGPRLENLKECLQENV